MLNERRYNDFGDRETRPCAHCGLLDAETGKWCAFCTEILVDMRSRVQFRQLSDWPNRNHKRMMTEQQKQGPNVH